LHLGQARISMSSLFSAMDLLLQRPRLARQIP
jgi:hypothetical protein